MPPRLSPADRAREIARVRVRRRSDVPVRMRQREGTRVAEKREWIGAFIAGGSAAGYPVAEQDLAEENATGTGARVTVSWLATEIGRALAHAEAETAVDARTLAWQLLGSYDPELYCHIAQIPLERLSVDRVLAHLEWLGWELPQQVAGSIARRLFLGLANQSKPAAAADSETEVCAECGATFPRGEMCRCQA
jgi:hypothetical protein